MLPEETSERGTGGSRSELPRRFAGFLATSLLSRDPLGGVYRALSLEEKPEGFVRLRILDGAELSRDRAASAVRDLAEKHPLPVSPVLAGNSRAGVHDGVPWVAWDESHGHALDQVLASASASRRGARLPPEHALLIADRLALALEHAARGGGRSSRAHGLLWPGFVTIGSAGDVRVGGFGMAPAVLPWASAPELETEIGPYLAPEARENANAVSEPGADVYSVGAVLLHLLSGTRPPGRAAAEAIGPAELYPPGVAEMLRGALSRAVSRRPSATQLRRDIGGVLVAGGLQPSSRALAAFVARRMETAAAGAAESPPAGEIPAEPRLSEDEEWELALSRLEPEAAAEPALRRLPRSGPPARVPLPPEARDPLSPGGPRRNPLPR
ncbi:MAG: hypothetical protein ABI914_07965 [Acidobacteriota bacterium]